MAAPEHTSEMDWTKSSPDYMETTFCGVSFLYLKQFSYNNGSSSIAIVGTISWVTLYLVMISLEWSYYFLVSP